MIFVATGNCGITLKSNIRKGSYSKKLYHLPPVIK
jgi:hypothetical protein